jgi:hypothetical protein
MEGREVTKQLKENRKKKKKNKEKTYNVECS